MIDTIINSFTIWTDAQGLKAKGRVKSIENISLEGIARLRELILELAVRGKLVPQGANDEPASELLKRIEKERKNRNITKKNKKEEQVNSSHFFDAKISGWEICKLDDIGETNIGLTYSPNDLAEKGTIVLRSSNIQDGEIELTDIVRVNKTIGDNVLVKKGDLLICARNGSKKLVGKCALIKDLNESMAFGAFMAIFRSPFNEYCRLFIESPIFRKNLEGVETTTINQITQDNLKNTYIPLPPLPEQHRIVAKVDELMALCDKLEAEQTNNLKTHQTLVKTLLETLTQAADAAELQVAWERITPHFEVLFCTEDSIEQLKQTILQLALMGKLVQQDPTDEPASELLKKIVKEKERLVKEGKLKKQTPLPEITEEEKPFELAKGWEWVRFSSITLEQNQGVNTTTENVKYEESGYPVIQAGNISSGFVQIGHEKFVHQSTFDRLPDKFKPKKDDILYSNIGANFGVAAIVSVNSDFIISWNVLRLKVSNQVCLGYVRLWLNSQFIRNYAWSQVGTSTVPFISGSKIELYKLPLPPLSEQHRIVAKVEELFGLCDALKERLQKAGELKVLLAKTVVEKAVMN